HESAKNQQLDDHYFGAIPQRVLAFMKDLEYECLKLGIPLKTRHNEVAPNQYELAPIYEEANLANDHNQLLMTIMGKVATRHHFRVLLHEKPFKGINGSGKHNNWSLGTDTGVNLLKPGRTAFENLQFITFLVNVISAVHRHNGLLKASVMSATNEHRLGAGEAPPTIISTFLGTQISEVLDKIECSLDNEDIRFDSKNVFRMGGLTQIPSLLLDNTDRNRTSPFAFTGNRFEFRAVGAQANCAASMIVLNTAVAEQLTDFKQRVDKLISSGVDMMKAILAVVREDIKTCKPIHFDGNGYSEEWRLEAEKRGLDVETNIPLILDQYLKPETVQMFSRMNVFTRAELEARNEIKLETYTKKIQIEARIFGDLCLNHIVPVATRYQSQLLDNVVKVAQVFPAEQAKVMNATNLSLIEKIAENTASITEHVYSLIGARKIANRLESEREKAIAYHDNVAPLIEQIRTHVDKLEMIVDDELWPLPKYREMLFIR
ncbi:MAG: glutamine synthetase type III, partial [Bacteroidaceae bacterium]|nr:glutamine synthetase type III [Bacteroidaceae bacterium]